MLAYRRKLPHWQPDNVAVFLTWRLWGSLPAGKLIVRHAASQTSGQAFAVADSALARQTSGPLWLGDGRVACSLVEAIRVGETERNFYELCAWTVMPNHVHLLIVPAMPLPMITRWLKGSTARKANLLLGRTGRPFWQDESFDHWVRSEKEFDRIVAYIEHNPVKAGFVESPELWPWSSASGQAKPPAPPL